MALRRGAILRFAVLALLLAGAFAAFRFTSLGQSLTPENVQALLERLRENPWAPAILIGLYLVLAPLGLPVSPLIVAGGVAFGPWFGWLYNFLGCLGGGVASFVLGRTLAHDLVQQLLPRRHLKRIEAMVERHAFSSLVRIRFVPVPFPVVNYGAALAGVSPATFTVATAIGLAPSILVYTFIGGALAEATGADRGALLVKLGLAIGGLLALSFLPDLIRRWRNDGEPDDA